MKTPAIITKVLTDYYRYLAGAVALIVVIAGYMLVIAPKLSDVQTSQISKQKTAEAELKSKQEYITALQQSNAQFLQKLPADRRQLIDDFIPTDSDFPGLILTVKNIVTQSRLTLDSISVGQGGQVAVAAGAATSTATNTSATTPTAQAATVGGLSVKTQDVSITVSGGSSYEAFKGLLANIESSRRLFDVVSVSFSAGGTTTTGTTSSSTAWSLILRSYYLPSK